MTVTTLTASAQFSNGFGKEQRGKQNPFRIYFLSYDLHNPGISIGPEYDFIYSSKQKVQCKSGVRYVQKKLNFVPQFGVFKVSAQSVAVFGTLELDFKTIYQQGWIFDMFASAGYAHIFGNETSDLGDIPMDEVLLTSYGSFFPQFGIGTGYDFSKRTETPIQVNLRVLSASVNLQEEVIRPALNIGITYNL